jgi:hypothetical protein
MIETTWEIAQMAWQYRIPLIIAGAYLAVMAFMHDWAFTPNHLRR